jgi:hypothetical protein
LKKELLALLFVIAFLSPIGVVFARAQATPALKQPRKVRICFESDCAILTSLGKYYDDNSPPGSKSSWMYRVDSWTSESIILSGRDSKAFAPSEKASKACAGSITPGGTGVDSGKGTITIGSDTRNVACTINWDDKSISSAASTPAVPTVSAPPTPKPIDQKPQTMRLQTNHVEILTWKGDHYDGVQEGQTTPMSRYTVERWDAGGVRFVGSPIAVPPGTFKVIFTGKLAPAGGSIADSNIQVIVNGKQTFNGPGFALTWDVKPVAAAPATPPPAPAAVATAPVAAPAVPSPAPAQAKAVPPPLPQLKAPPKTAPPAKAEVAQKTGDAGVPPKTMRLCINANPQCWDLNWVSDHYEAINNNPVFPSWRFWLNSWEDDHVEFTGKTQKSFPGSDFPLEGTFSGKVSAKGSSIFDGRFDWKVGYSQSGVYPITLTWDKTPSNVADVADISVYKTAHRSAEHGNITLPPGASESFANFGADVRAVLLPESDLSPSKAGMACNEAVAAGVSATDSLEIGKAAYRAGDLTRGHCWIKRAAGMGNIRARVLLGVAAMNGLGTPQDFKAAFDYFEPSDSDKDPWGTYFLVQCYAYGIGVPMDKQKSGQIEAYLDLKGGGEDIHSLIGSDDIETVKRYERIQLLINPPKAILCSGKAACDTANRELYQQRLDEINAQH